MPRADPLNRQMRPKRRVIVAVTYRERVPARYTKTQAERLSRAVRNGSPVRKYVYLAEIS